MATFSNNNLTNNIASGLANPKPKVEYSVDQIGRQNVFDAFLGAIIPFDVFPTLPGSTYELSYNILTITNNPLVRRIFSECNIYVHSYYQKMNNIWEGAPTAITGGQSGKIVKTFPYSDLKVAVSNGYSYAHQYSPSSYLGIPPLARFTGSIKNDWCLMPHYSHHPELGEVINDFNVKFNALPLAMYQQICSFNYLPRNLLIDSCYFPENERHFRFSSSLDTSTPVFALSYDDSRAHSPIPYVAFPTGNQYDPDVGLNRLMVRQFDGDLFNTGLPFPDLVRGEIPSVDFAATAGSVTIPANQVLTDRLQYVYVQRNSSPSDDLQLRLGNNISDQNYVQTGITLPNENQPLIVRQNGNSNRNLVLTNSLTGSVNVSIQSSLTMSQLRTLEVLTAMRERAARTDGTYNAYIEAMFGTNPHYDSGKPRYIGGFKQPILWSEVVQQSASNSDSALGTVGSRGVSSQSGYVGVCHADDFGYIMSVLMIVPKTVYTQGLERMWSHLSVDDLWFPQKSNLSPSPILNKELYISGDDSVDNGLFAWQERAYEYKERRNIATGNLAFSREVTEEYSAYIMKRHFATTPNLSYAFTGMFPSNMDYTVFSNMLDSPFIISASGNIKATQPIPAIVVPDEAI